MQRAQPLEALAMPRLKWHMLRRLKSDPAFLRSNLHAALHANAACEVDLRLSADGHALCLHDRRLDRETTGHGPVGDATRAQIAQLRQRDADGAPGADAPLFLDELAATVRALGATLPAQVQLDVKVPAQDLTDAAVQHIAAIIGANAGAFVASASDWGAVLRLTEALPALHAGFDPLALYPRALELDAAGYAALARATLAAAPTASVYYLEARLVLAALDQGVNLVDAVTGNGAWVDAWTVDADHPDLRRVLKRLIDAGCQQITSNDPLLLETMLLETMLSEQMTMKLSRAAHEAR